MDKPSRPLPKFMLRPADEILQAVTRFSHLELVKVAVDVCLILLAAGWAWLVSFGQVRSPGSPLPFIVAVLIARLVIYFALRVHQTSWLHFSRFEVLWLAFSAVLGPPVIACTLWLLPDPFSLGKLTRPFLVLMTEPALYLVLLFGARMTVRATARTKRGKGVTRVLIIGAGDSGRALAFQIQESRFECELVGFVDDDARKQKRRFRGLPVLGTTSDLEEVLQGNDVDEVVIAITGLPKENLRRIMAVCEDFKTPVRILPPLGEIIGGRPDYRALREVRMEDLLARPEVKLDYEAITGYLGGRVVLVTGGGGSIGGELCRQVMAAGAKKLIVLGRGENSVFEMVQELIETKNRCEIVPAICDVRDRIGLAEVFRLHKPHVVFHAAAHKHVPLMEQYPSEAIKNNVVGTLNVVELSVEHEVEHFVMVSTDKAVDPSSVMGATKRLGEMIVKGYAASTGMNMVSVRFGNVLGSRGSVVPTMKRRILQGQCINITDPEMVRFFMTIPEASRLILQAGAVGGCGEVFILDMGEPVRILDLAHDLIRLSGLVPGQDVEIRITGRRPGEKIREEILTEKESIEAEKRGPFFMALPENIELASLLEQIEALRLSAMQNNTAAVVNGIAGIVPNFHPDRGVHKNGIMISECPAPDAPFMENGLPPKHLVS